MAPGRAWPPNFAFRAKSHCSGPKGEVGTERGDRFLPPPPRGAPVGRAGLYPPSGFLNLVSGSCPVLRGSNSAGGRGRNGRQSTGVESGASENGTAPFFFTPKTRGENESAENANWSVFLLLRFIKSGTQSPSFRAHVGRKATAP